MPPRVLSVKAVVLKVPVGQVSLAHVFTLFLPPPPHVCTKWVSGFCGSPLLWQPSFSGGLRRLARWQMSEQSNMWLHTTAEAFLPVPGEETMPFNY